LALKIVVGAREQGTLNWEQEESFGRFYFSSHTFKFFSSPTYHKISHSQEEIEKLFVDIFLESYSSPPKQITLDLDVTDDLVHGNQEQAFFNTYYGGYCYAPLYIFCGKHLLAARLRASNVDPAEGALSELQRVIQQIRINP
jgi:hypothetical protein